MKNFFRKFMLLMEKIITTIIHVIGVIVKVTKDNPMQTLAPLGVLVCSGIMIITDSTALNPILMGIQTVLLFLQCHATFRSVKNSHQRRGKEDKESLQRFFERAGPISTLSSRRGGYHIRFLSIYKDSWFRAWYYHFKGITRLSLYRYGDMDDVGSYTKFKVNAKDFFYLQLKGCIDTEEPDKAVEGIDHIAKEYLTKQHHDAIISNT